MKNYLLLISLSVLTFGCASSPPVVLEAKPKSEFVWTQKQGLQNPESALYDEASKSIYVSNVAGGADQKDKTGWISKLNTDGTMAVEKWVEGLDAPKGMVIVGKLLWVTNIDELVSIDLATAKIVGRLKIKGAKFLNDLAADSKGVVYASDMAGDAIYAVKNNKATVFFKGVNAEAPNGLKVIGNSLYVAGWGTGFAADFSVKTLGHLYSLDLKSKKKTLITKEPLGNLDGLESLANGHFLVSDWMNGKVYDVDVQGQALMVYQGPKGTADIGWIEGSQTLLIPKMMENEINALQK